MFARVSKHRGETERLLGSLRRTTEPLGFERAYFLTDSEGGRAIKFNVRPGARG